jgi:hypothetical protein
MRTGVKVFHRLNQGNIKMNSTPFGSEGFIRQAMIIRDNPIWVGDLVTGGWDYHDFHKADNLCKIN